MPCDGGFDTGIEQALPPLNVDDPRVQRLEEEVQLWTAASHAMYVVWSIVQATDDIIRRIDEWLGDPQAADEAEVKVDQLRADLTSLSLKKGNTEMVRKPELHRGKSGEDVFEDSEDRRAQMHSQNSSLPAPAPQAGDFDYLGYALERIELFRKELEKLGLYR